MSRISSKGEIAELDDTSDLQWFASNQDKLKKYLGKYVAIYHKKIIGYGETMNEAHAKARKADSRADPIIALVAENYQAIF
jgi:hypothetical protein